ncbi:hypothetical protein [Bacillus marinisedimentorum]|uniref:hypothetical protein n=1 Tax=Bacillus marinisedimentorum TaxID=1821260 RepID=UPI00087208E5|nr:hypothetical protein [Bacillus marinisedimentorum]
MPDHWFGPAIGDLAQSLGMSAAGLLFIKLADPGNETPAKDAFSYKQMLVDVFVGGGFVTAASIFLITAFGAVPVLIAAAVITLGWLALGLFISVNVKRSVPDARG